MAAVAKATKRTTKNNFIAAGDIERRKKTERVVD
jgi:hypothetical protein